MECGRHLNIELLTLTDIIGVSGEKGNFSVRVRKNPRYIDMEKCIACGLCSKKCPRKVGDEYNAEMAKRRAIHIQYDQTVPLKYLIDGENCLYLTRGRCRACEKFCPTKAINFDDKEEFLTINVGAVVLAPGYKPFDPSDMSHYGYKEIPDVVTSLEYERLLSVSGPCTGHLLKPSDGREPKRIAWLQCVGSRNVSDCANGYCSSVCCMYAIKQALVTAEHLTGDSLNQTIFYMDIRTHGKEFERYYEDAVKKGVKFVNARPRTFSPGKNNTGVRVSYILDSGERVSEEFDMMVLSIGLEPSEDAQYLAETFGFELTDNRFVKTDALNPVTSTRDGVYAIGAFLSPKAIPRSVTEASAAATAASVALSGVRNTMTQIKTYPDEKEVSLTDPRVGVFVCSCGINIANTVDVKAVLEYAKTLPNVVYAENNLFTCSTDTQELISEKIRENNLDRVVVAACSPLTHEPLFQDTLREGGLNAFLIEMANIRNQNSWVHMDEPEKATAKAKDQVRMAVAKVIFNYPLQRQGIKVVRKALVIGGGLSGMTAALGFADQGYETILIEKSGLLGGAARNLEATWCGEDIGVMVADLDAKVRGHDKITLMLNARVKSCSGSVGNFESVVETADGDRTIQYGVAVMATGATEYQPEEYLFGQDPRVMTHLQFDETLKKDESAIRASASVVFIQCVGSRDETHPYCSRVCCTHSVQNAIRLKTLNPETEVYILHRDIRTYGEREDLYREARRLGVIFVRYDLDRKPNVYAGDDNLYVEIFAPILQRVIRLSPDYLVLAAAIIPRENRELNEFYKCGVNEDGFLLEAHPKLRPVDMTSDGLFIAGLCHYPKPVDESVAQAMAAVARAGSVLANEVMALDAVKAYVTDLCDGCAVCLDVCPYNAIRLETSNGNGREITRVATDTAVCKGCGLCEASCPKGGIYVHGFTLDQLEAQVNAVIERRI